MATANKDGNTPLHFAAKNGTAALIRKLVETGDDLNAQNSDGNTPMHIAFLNNNQEAGLTLVTLGADANIRNREGRTPRDYIKDY